MNGAELKAFADQDPAVLKIQIERHLANLSAAVTHETEIIAQLLGKLVANAQQTRPTFTKQKGMAWCEFIVGEVAQSYGFTLDDLLGKDRHRPVATARNVAMFLCSELVGTSYSKLGAMFSRDHTTVMSACNGIRERRTKEPELKAQVDELMLYLSDIMRNGAEA